METKTGSAKIGSMTHVIPVEEASYLSDSSKPKIGSMTHVIPVEEASYLSDSSKAKIGSMTHVIPEASYLSDCAETLDASARKLIVDLLSSSTIDPVSVKSNSEMWTMYLYGLSSKPNALMAGEAYRAILQHKWIEFVKLYMDIFEFPKLTNSQKAKVFERPDVVLLSSMIKQEAILFGLPLVVSQERWQTFVEYAQQQRNEIVEAIQSCNVTQAISSVANDWSVYLSTITSDQASQKMFQSKTKNIYSESNAGKRFLSIDIRQAFATMLFHFLGRSCLELDFVEIGGAKFKLDNSFDWAKIMELFPDADCFSRSKWFRNLVTNFACLNCGILPLVELAMRFCTYDILKAMAGVFPKLQMVYVCQDEIVYELSETPANWDQSGLADSVRGGITSRDMHDRLSRFTRDWIPQFVHIRAYELIAKKINGHTYFVRDFGDSTDCKNLNPEDRYALEQSGE